MEQDPTLRILVRYLAGQVLVKWSVENEPGMYAVGSGADAHRISH